MMQAFLIAFAAEMELQMLSQKYDVLTTANSMRKDVIDSSYAAFTALEVVDETSFCHGPVRAGSFECDGQQCRREAGQH